MKNHDPFNTHFFNLRYRKRSKHSEDFSIPRLNSKPNHRYKNSMNLYLPCDLQPILPLSKMAATIEAGGVPSRFANEDKFSSPEGRKPYRDSVGRKDGSSERGRAFQSIDASQKGSKHFVQSIYLKNGKQLPKPSGRFDKQIEEQFCTSNPTAGFEQSRFSQMISGGPRSKASCTLECVDKKLNILPIGAKTRGALNN